MAGLSANRLRCIRRLVDCKATVTGGFEVMLETAARSMSRPALSGVDHDFLGRCD